METDMTEVVQPPEDAGQGDAGTTDAPYAEYLNRIPEEARGDVEPVFKEWDANVTRRFQEASEYRKNWEPFEQLGVNRYDPTAVQSALQFYEAVQTNPQGVWEWAQEYAREHGLTAAQAVEVAQQAQQQDVGFDAFGADPQAMKQLLEDALAPVRNDLTAINQWRQQQEQALQLAEGQRVIDGQFAELEKQHNAGNRFSQETRELIETLANKYIDTDPQHAIPRAFSDYEKWRADIQRSTLQAKVDAPPAAESGGVPDVAPPQIKTLADAEKYALEQLRAQRG